MQYFVNSIKYFMFLVFLILNSYNLNAVEIVSHEAKYEMNLLRYDDSSTINSIVGKSVFKLFKECNAWISSEDYYLKFSYTSGDSDILASSFNSWEEFSGKLYSFDVYEGSSFENEKKFNGYVNLPPNSKKPEVFFSNDLNTKLKIPDDIFFPVAHTIETIKKAEQGKKIFPSHIFMGSESDRALKRTNSIIGSIQSTKLKKDLGKLIESDYYPIQVAYFDLDPNESLPEYQIKFHMQKNGVVSYYEVDYGDFVISAKLKEIRAIENRC